MLELPFQSHVKFIVACVEVGESRISGTVISQLNGNPTLSKDGLAWIKVGTLYLKPINLLAVAHL